MSTRSLIKFVYGKDSVTIYRHWDGYLSGVLPELEEFLKWNGWRNDDLTYTVANFVSYFKLKSALSYLADDYKVKDKPKSLQNMLDKPDFNDYLHTGYGIFQKMTEKEVLASWAEFYYVIDLKKHTVTSYAIAKTELVNLGTSKMIAKDPESKEFVCVKLEHPKKILKEIEKE